MILYVYLNSILYIYTSILWYLTLISPLIVSWLLLSFLTLSYHAHLRVDLGLFGVRFEVHFGVHFDSPGDLPERPQNGPKKHLKPGGPKHCKTAAGTPKTGIRSQGAESACFVVNQLVRLLLLSNRRVSLYFACVSMYLFAPYRKRRVLVHRVVYALVNWSIQSCYVGQLADTLYVPPNVILHTLVPNYILEFQRIFSPVHS